MTKTRLYDISTDGGETWQTRQCDVTSRAWMQAVNEMTITYQGVERRYRRHRKA